MFALRPIGECCFRIRSPPLRRASTTTAVIALMRLHLQDLGAGSHPTTQRKPFEDIAPLHVPLSLRLQDLGANSHPTTQRNPLVDKRNPLAHIDPLHVPSPRHNARVPSRQTGKRVTCAQCA